MSDGVGDGDAGGDGVAGGASNVSCPGRSGYLPAAEEPHAFDRQSPERRVHGQPGRPGRQRRIVAAVAYVRQMDELFDLAKKRGVSLTVYALADEGGFPSLAVLRRFVEHAPPRWRLFLTRRYYHPKILWFDGVGCYIGSANLTQQGWWDNLECGVWLSAEELRRDNWEDQIEAMLGVVQERSREAMVEDIERFEKIAHRRRDLRTKEQGLARFADKEFADLPGQQPPDRVVRHGARGGAAKVRFVRQWEATLTLLRKLGQLADRARPWPDWVEADVNPAIAFDQATEYWYTLHVRDQALARGRDEAVDKLHERNKANPDAAVAAALAEWRAFNGVHERGHWPWPEWCNENPRRLHELLQPAAIEKLDVVHLTEVAWLTHACREHARQVNNATLGLPQGTTMDLRDRCAEYAKYLLRQRTAVGDRDVRDMLLFVLWGEPRNNYAGRIWDATTLGEWKLPHLGPNILGEMLGYAKPDQCPPRNARVVRSLRALGYDMAV